MKNFEQFVEQTNSKQIVELFHITELQTAEIISQIGFDPNILRPGNSFFFTNKEKLKYWIKILTDERKWNDYAVFKILVSKDFFDNNFINQFGWKSGQYMYKGHKEVLNNNPFGWIKQDIVPLEHNKNCKIHRIH